MAAYVIMCRALRRQRHFTALITFTDSTAAMGAVNSGSSASSALRPLLHALFAGGEQHLATRVSTTENAWADAASRGQGDSVAAAAQQLGWDVERLDMPDSDWDPLRLSISEQQPEERSAAASVSQPCDMSPTTVAAPGPPT